MAQLKVSSKDIFPLIKKFLYNDQDIFLRELVSNAVDATQKLNTLSARGEYSGEIKNEVHVTIDTDRGTLTIDDFGIGMTEEEVQKYICQIAFSGATDFIEKYADADIIGHFGMGFYSAFMVADRVDLYTSSYTGAPTVWWSCEGNVNYKIKETPREEDKPCGTRIVLTISDTYKEYFTADHIKELLDKYNKYIKVPVKFIEILPETIDSSTNEPVHHDPKETLITSDNALWTRKPDELTDEDYIKFYHELYPNKPDPVFWLHLNIDHPFTFTGILYFPAYDIKKPIFEKTNLQLYCNQVFVTNNLEGVLPEYLRMLHGVIDSPDIPLNMSRSDLQSDSNVKKIRGYISNKVFSSLKRIMKNDRESYELKWDTIKTFINLGIIMEDDVYDKFKDILLFTDTDGVHYTFDEYYDKIKDTQVNKDDKVCYLYTHEKTAHTALVSDLKELGYNILLMDSPYNSFEAHSFEIEINKDHKNREEKDGTKQILFKRIDSEPINMLIEKKVEETEDKKEDLSPEVKNMITSLFMACKPEIEKIQFSFTVQHMGEKYDPIVITVDELFRRMKEMQTLNNEGFYVGMDTRLTVILNEDSDVFKTILSNAEKTIGTDIMNINNEASEIRKKYEVPEGEKLDDEKRKEMNEEYKALNEKKDAIISEYAKTDNHINELIDIALLEFGLLKGEALHKFVKRSFKMIFD